MITPNKTVNKKYGVNSPSKNQKLNVKNNRLNKTLIIIMEYNFNLNTSFRLKSYN